MSAQASVISLFGNDRWNADMYGSLSLASRISALVKANGQSLKVLWFLRRLNSALDGFFADIHAAMEGRVKFEAQSDNKQVTISEVRCKLTELHRLMSTIHDYGRKSGLTNNSLFSIWFGKLHRHTEGIEDLIDWLDVIENAAETKALFDRAEREAQAGEPLDLSRVR